MSKLERYYRKITPFEIGGFESQMGVKDAL